MKLCITSDSRHFCLASGTSHSLVPDSLQILESQIIPFPFAKKEPKGIGYSNPALNWEDVTFAMLGACAAGTVVLAFMS